MKVAIGITTYNRPEYLKKMADSLNQTAGLNSGHIYIYDDCSTEIDEQFLESLFPFPTSIFRHPQNIGSSPNIFYMYYDFVKRGTEDVLFNADADLLFNPNWLNKLLQLMPKTKGFLSLYNSVLHPSHRSLLIDGETIAEKEHIGSAGAAFSLELMTKVVNTVPGPFKGYDWEWSKLLHKNKIPLISTEQSYIQHIGLQGFNSSSVHFFDFGLNFQPGNEITTKHLVWFLDRYILGTKSFYDHQAQVINKMVEKRIQSLFGLGVVKVYTRFKDTTKKIIKSARKIKAKIRFRLKHPLGLSTQKKT